MWYLRLGRTRGNAWGWGHADLIALEGVVAEGDAAGADVCRHW